MPEKANQSRRRFLNSAVLASGLLFVGAVAAMFGALINKAAPIR